MVALHRKFEEILSLVLTGQALQKLNTYKCVMQNFAHLSKTKIQPRCNSFLLAMFPLQKKEYLKFSKTW